MHDERSFLDAILAEPNDDNVRLVYADWLQENGQFPRAQFIRVGIELFHTPEPRTIEKNYGARDTQHVCIRCDEGDCRFHMLQKRQYALSNLYADAWVPICRATYNWIRGFVESVSFISAEDWMRVADILLAAHPIREVIFSSWPLADFDKDGIRFVNDPHGVRIPWGTIRQELATAPKGCPEVSAALVCRFGRQVHFKTLWPPAERPAFTWTIQVKDATDELVFRLNATLGTVNAAPFFGFGTHQILLSEWQMTPAVEGHQVLTLRFVGADALVGYESTDFFSLIVDLQNG